MFTVQEKIRFSLIESIQDDESLLIHDVKEETISHAIASSMSKQFPDWDVDPEYNRFGAEQKRKIDSVSKE